MRKEVAISKFEKLIKALGSQLEEKLISIILFGSRARGEGTGMSDWDIFIIAEKLPDHPFDRQLLFRKIVPKEFPFQVSFYPKTVKEFEKDFPAIYLDIATDGIILFDRDNFAQKRLQRIREIIHGAGLKRVRKFNSLIWVWKDQPRVGWGIDWSGIYGLHRRSKVQTKA